LMQNINEDSEDERAALMTAIFTLAEYCLDQGEQLEPEICLLLKHLTESEVVDDLSNCVSWSMIKRVDFKVQAYVQGIDTTMGHFY